ncbi:MAG: hypothetical protein O7D91_04395 [Planctomycetota bacterium]|nr:hypothetical protein [Planctomycetota bacterium]
MPSEEQRVSFAEHIRPLFTQTDIDHMSWFCDLTSYDDVKDLADQILKRLRGQGGAVMPPSTDGGPWPEGQIALFERWIEQDFPP